MNVVSGNPFPETDNPPRSTRRLRKMSLLKNNRCFPALVAAALLAALACAPVKSSTITTRHFYVMFSPGDEYDARMVAQYAEDSLAGISGELGYTPSPEAPRTPMRIFATRPDFTSGTGIDKSKMVVGRAWSGTEKIEIDASGAYARVEQVVAHEVTHIVIARLLGPRTLALPLWANEGIAKNESGAWRVGDDEAVGGAISEGKFIPLSEIKTRFPSDSDQAALAYAEGTSVMHYLRQRYGAGVFKALLARTAATGDFDKAVTDATGSALRGLESAWKRSVASVYSGGWLQRNLPSVLGIAMALLCVAAYAAIRRKLKQRDKQWEEEHYDDDGGLDWGPPPE